MILINDTDVSELVSV